MNAVLQTEREIYVVDLTPPPEVLSWLRSGQRLRAVHLWSQRAPMSIPQASTAVDALLAGDLELRETYLQAIGLDRLLRLELHDGLQLPSGFLARAHYACVLWLRCPSSWWPPGTAAPPALLEAACELLYGADFKRGNSDGSRYVVLEWRADALAGPQLHDWQAATNGPDQRHWFVHAMADGGIAKVDRALF